MKKEDRLLKLLKYSREAIDYWFEGVDCDDTIREENDYFKEEVDYFINNIESNSIAVDILNDKNLTSTNDNS